MHERVAMMRGHSLIAALGLVGILAGSPLCAAENPKTASPAKKLLLPAKIWRVPDGNDYTNPDSEYCYRRSAMSADIAMFWAKEYGDDPTQNPDTKRRFNPAEALKECDRFYSDYVNKLKFVLPGHSLADKYKLVIFVIGGNEGTAYGGGAGQIGVLWTPAVRMNRKPYGALAHEIGHSFQYLNHADGGTSPRNGSLAEMTSQWMLWQEYPDWQTFENYHLVAFLKQTNLAFLHPENMYHSPYVLEYWSEHHGLDFIGRLWREAWDEEDVVTAYKRLTHIDQKAFNDEIFDASRRFVTWDLPRIEKVAAKYANQDTCELHAANDGWYEIAKERCPENYGYNAIRLTVPPAGTKVVLQFKGEAGAAGFGSVRTDLTGWRYGFLASKSDGSRVYGPMQSADDGKTEFAVPAGTKFLWLVVTGAPTEHFQHSRGDEDGAYARWPYRIRLDGAAIDPADVK